MNDRIRLSDEEPDQMEDDFDSDMGELNWGDNRDIKKRGFYEDLEHSVDEALEEEELDEEDDYEDDDFEDEHPLDGSYYY